MAMSGSGVVLGNVTPQLGKKYTNTLFGPIYWRDGTLLMEVDNHCGDKLLHPKYEADPVLCRRRLIRSRKQNSQLLSVCRTHHWLCQGGLAAGKYDLEYKEGS